MRFDFTITPRTTALAFAIAASVLMVHVAKSQETVFTMFKTPDKKGDQYFVDRKYKYALDQYLQQPKSEKSEQTLIRIAECYYQLHQPKNAATYYEKVIARGSTMPANDLYYYAEVLTSLKQYERAIEFYTSYSKKTNDALALQKIWRLKNRSYLFEDSAHYSISPITVNSSAGDLSPIVYQDKLIFLSNRTRQKLVNYVDENNNSFYKLYFAGIKHDTTTDGITDRFDKPFLFGPELQGKFHQGPVVFFGHGQRMAYTTTNEDGNSSKRTLQLHFATLENDHWAKTSSFKYNSTEYSVTDPFINEEGTALYFSSDMKDGYGGKDLYKSIMVNGQWSKPVNLGDKVNTSSDERYPFVHGSILYFTSNGQAGLGGLDIFKASLHDGNIGEIENLGYPVNSASDDFSLTLQPGTNRGFFASNRSGNDDIYELDMDLQTYPVTISAILKSKDENWRDSTELKILPNAKLFLIDNSNGKVVGQTSSDKEGAFLLTVPYFSQYRIKVVAPDSDEVFVSLELSKNRKAGTNYEIVIVKNVFKNINKGVDNGKQ
jgi:hypothetical protein